MREWTKIRLSEGELQEIENAEKQVMKEAKLLRKLQAIKLKNEGWKHARIASFFGVVQNTITEWLKAYKEGGVQKLLEWNYSGRVSILTEEQQQQILERNKQNPFSTAKEAKAYIEEEFNIVWHLHFVQKLLKKNFVFRTKK